MLRERDKKHANGGRTTACAFAILLYSVVSPLIHDHAFSSSPMDSWKMLSSHAPPYLQSVVTLRLYDYVVYSMCGLNGVLCIYDFSTFSGHFGRYTSSKLDHLFPWETAFIAQI